MEPLSGQKDSGWLANQAAVSSYFNWLFNTIYTWIAWLDTQLSDEAYMAGRRLIVSVPIKTVGDTQLGDDIADIISVVGSATFTQDVTLAANKSVVLSGTGRIKHGDYLHSFIFNRSMVIDSTGGAPGSTAGVGGVSQAGSISAYYNLPNVPPGLSGNHLRLKSITVFGTITGIANTATLYSVDQAGTYHSVVSAVFMSSGTGSTTLTVASPVVRPGEQYALLVASNSGTCVLRGCDMAWDLV